MHFSVVDPKSRRQIAQIHLNGHTIESGGPLGLAGAMRSFTLLKGSVWSHWSTQQPVLLRFEDGREAPVRIAALPAEEGEAGFVEFL